MPTTVSFPVWISSQRKKGYPTKAAPSRKNTGYQIVIRGLTEELRAEQLQKQ